MRSLRWIPPAALALVCLAAASSVRAAVFIPTKTADTEDGTCSTTDCSLREAVLAANASPGEDVILLHAGVYRLTLTGAGENAAATGDLDITDDLVLIGDGASSTILDGNAADRLFEVTDGDALQLLGVTLRNGQLQSALQNGGAVRNAGTLSITRSVLSGNTAASGFGGALYNEGTLTVVESTVSGNTASGGGGGATLGGTSAFTNVTFSGNRSLADFGGGIYVFSDGVATFNNVTVTGNTAAQRGGGVFAETSAFIGTPPAFSNSILAGNTASSDPDCSNSAASAGFNLVGVVATCLSFSAAKNDLVGTAATPLNPQLGPLGENGGPTPTHPFLAGSPALNKGNPAAPGSGATACAPTDQRGADRPDDQSTGAPPVEPRCDIGAFEHTTQCLAGGGTLCLNEGRFRVTATWRTSNSNGPGQGVTLTGDTGYFAFFDPSNVEVTIKVLNGCGLNNRYWVFASGMTNVEVALTVTDTQTGLVKTYTNPLNRTFRSILDTDAFAACQ